MAIHNYHDSWMSVEEYLELEENSEERYEYLDGYVYMQAGGSPNHAVIIMNIGRAIGTLLEDSPCRTYSSEARVYLSATRYVHPDVTVGCDDRDSESPDVVRYPRVVIEVLSPSTRAYDRGKKFAAYRECPTVQEYVMIESDRPLVEVHRRGKNGFWVCRTFGPEDEVELFSLDIRFSVADVYKKIKFLKR